MHECMIPEAEYKVEVGHGGCDSFTEVIAYYVEGLELDLAEISCLPNYLLEIVGPHVYFRRSIW